MKLSNEYYCQLDQFINKYIDRLIEFCGEALTFKDYLGINRIVLFGSFARGTINTLSDLDILFVVSGVVPPSAVEMFLMNDISIENEKRYAVDIAIDVHAMSEYRYEHPDPKSSFEANLHSEGVTLWSRHLV